MTSMFLIPVMMGLWLAQAPDIDRPVLSIGPNATATLRHMKRGKHAFMQLETRGVSVELVRVRVRVDGNTFDLDAVEEGIRLETDDGIGIFEEKTIAGSRKN